MKRNQKMQTWYLVKYMPSGAWVGTCGDSIQAVTSSQANRWSDEKTARDWALHNLRGKDFVVEPMEFPA